MVPLAAVIDSYAKEYSEQQLAITLGYAAPYLFGVIVTV